MPALLVALALVAGSPEVGSEVAVDPGDGPGSDLGCLVAIDGPAYAAFCRAFKADDPEGLAELCNDNRAFFIQKGTRVRVIEYHPGFDPKGVEVRILTGYRKGRKAWMPTYYLPVNAGPRPRR